MAIEKYIAAASLALYVMFTMEIITLYNFMQISPDELLKFVLEPEPKILQFISIGVAPASIMAAVSFIMTRRYGSRPVGYMIVAGGCSLLVGMAYTMAVLSSGVHDAYLSIPVMVLPPVILAVSVPVMVFGLMLFRSRVRRIKKGYV